MVSVFKTKNSLNSGLSLKIAWREAFAVAIIAYYPTKYFYIPGKEVKKHHFLLKEMVIFDPFLAKVR